jgi:hypothetical protein
MRLVPIPVFEKGYFMKLIVLPDVQLVVGKEKLPLQQVLL